MDQPFALEGRPSFGLHQPFMLSQLLVDEAVDQRLHTLWSVPMTKT
ncbi:hypothetical protein [Streptomyces roseifaciens]|nr:hypothetical protein [Streptomyces roseifaciens]